jgi:hypothetical protein
MSPTAQAKNNWAENLNDDVSESIKQRCRAALDDFEEIATNYKDPFIHVDKRIAPVEFIFIGSVYFSQCLRLLTDPLSVSDLPLHHA